MSRSTNCNAGNGKVAWYFARTHGCEILVLNQERLSPEQEMVQELMTIVRGFSSRLYGLRTYRKKLKEVLKQDVRGQLTHKIRLYPTPQQVAYFKRACGTVRFVWN